LFDPTLKWITVGSSNFEIVVKTTSRGSSELISWKVVLYFSFRKGLREAVSKWKFQMYLERIADGM